MKKSYNLEIMILMSCLILIGCSTEKLTEKSKPSVSFNDKSKFLSTSSFSEKEKLEILGVVLGKEFVGIPDCKISSKVICYEKSASVDEIKNMAIQNTEMLNIKWDENRLGMNSFERVSVRLIDGLVHEIKLDTKGLLYQKQVANELEKRFGLPMIDKEIKMQVENGRVFDSLYQVWYFNNKNSISFLGVTSTLSKGYVVLMTDRMLKIRADEIKRSHGL